MAKSRQPKEGLHKTDVKDRPVGNMAVWSPVLVPQSRDHVPQAKKPHVDVDALLESLSVGLGLLLSLAASQVDQMKLKIKNATLNKSCTVLPWISWCPG